MSSETRRAVLVVLSGRPGTGKTTVAREVARRLGACYLRVDAAETALARVVADVGVGGYAVVHELAVSNLLLGATVVVDAVNPVAEARASWREAATRAGAALVNVETALPDREEHRRRVETRVADIPGHVVPTWEDVEAGKLAGVGRGARRRAPAHRHVRQRRRRRSGSRTDRRTTWGQSVEPSLSVSRSACGGREIRIRVTHPVRGWTAMRARGPPTRAGELAGVDHT